MVESIITKCSDCIFYKKSERICEMDLLSVFQNENTVIDTDENGDKTINRICQFQRTRDWHGNSEILEERIHNIENEVYISGSLILLVESLDGLQNHLNQLKSIKNINKFSIIVSHPEHIKKSEIKAICSKIFNSTDHQFSEYILQQSFVNDKTDAIYSAFKYVKNGFTFILETDKSIDLNFIDKINYIINKKLKQICYIPAKDGDFHQTVFMAIIYKYFGGDKNRSMIDKIKEQQYSNMIMTWDQIDENYNTTL